jgi:hypothetical protein
MFSEINQFQKDNCYMFSHICGIQEVGGCEIKRGTIRNVKGERGLGDNKE